MSTEGFHRDPFGFRQIIVTVTKFGKVFGIDSSNGQIIWTRILGDQIMPMKLHVLKTVSDGGDPEVVLVAQKTAENVRVHFAL